MCGITGILTFGDRKSETLSQTCADMANQMHHRGPDDFGVWTDSRFGVALGHRRLAILDLSQEGHQPMVSACGNYVIVFNGEVYNFEAIRHDLQSTGLAPCFRGNSDTEVVLAAISAWGLERAVMKFIGMFALAVWDRRQACLSLVRDRLGIKPLYFGWAGKTFVFGSELKALTVHPDFRRDIDIDALALYFRHNYIPTPYCIYRNTFKLEPGHIVTIRMEGRSGLGSPAVEDKVYWSAEEVILSGAREPWKGTDREAVDALESLMLDAVRLRMVADVPLGALLSGGVDSSTIVALMQSISNFPVKTFTIGYHDRNYDESVFARSIAGHLKTDHTELYVTDREAAEVIPKLPFIYDEPFGDSSQIPTFLVCQLAKQYVTVAVSGDGGDELFSGYHAYARAIMLWKWFRRIPALLRLLAVPVLRRIPTPLLDVFGNVAAPALKAFGFKQDALAAQVKKLVQVLPELEFASFYRALMSHVGRPADYVTSSQERPTFFSISTKMQGALDNYQLMSYLDCMHYLPDNNLTKVDRASMAVSLEVRVPIIDHRVFAFAFQIPSHLKVRLGKGKWILHQVLNRHVPAYLTERPKQGFAIPVERWVTDSLRPWAEELLEPGKMDHQGYLNTKMVHSLWKEQLSGRTDRRGLLWLILMFQAWLEDSRR